MASPVSELPQSLKILPRDFKHIVICEQGQLVTIFGFLNSMSLPTSTKIEDNNLIFSFNSTWGNGPFILQPLF